jgi:sugar lactone lactonase YvrE
MMCNGITLIMLALASASEASRYIIVSAPRFAKVSYFKAPDKTPYSLIDSGLRSPQGLAVDHKSSMLFVADPDVRKVFGYKLGFIDGANGPMLRTEGEPRVAAQNIEARWVAVDGEGTVFFTDELRNVIMKVRAEDFATGTAKPEVVYDGSTVTEVNRPGGIAVDNFFVFWSNKAVGTQVGSVVKAAEEPPSAPEASVTQIAKNSNKVYGVCLSQNNVFYTDTQKFLFAVKKTGGATATISDRLLGPRGCSWDGDATVYIADKAAGALYSFPGNMHNLAPAKLTKFADFDDAFGVAVVQAAAHWTAFVATLLLFA